MPSTLADQSATARRALVLCVFWMVAATVFFFTYDGLQNDHFGRISLGRQLARYGDIPFRDFFDPGWLFTDLASAAVQRLAGENLLGEVLLNVSFMAGGASVVVLLAWRVSRSLPIALAAGLLAVFVTPRAYDYDKVLFYPLGVLVCWRYLERRSWRALLLLAATIVVAGLFRYDTGIFVALAAVTGIVALDAGRWTVAARSLAMLGLLVLLLATPVLLFVQFQSGLGDAIDQIMTYTAREGERTRLKDLPVLSWSAIAMRDRAATSSLLSYIVIVLPLAAAMSLSRPRFWTAERRLDTAQIAALAMFCGAVILLILRAPLFARYGGMAGPTIVLGVWLMARTWSAGALVRVANIAILAVALWCVSGMSQVFAREAFRPARAAGYWRKLVKSPPDLQLLNRSTQALIQYVHTCTDPDDRVLALWFAPELYYFAQRGFAGGMVVFFDGHWSEPRFQQRITEALSSQDVPLVIDVGSPEAFRVLYPIVDGYLRQSYDVAGETDFGLNDQRFRILAARNRQPVGTYAGSRLPCFREQAAAMAVP